MSYQEKLKDPRWKNKRREILITLCQYCHEADHEWTKIRERTVRERRVSL